MKMYLFIYGCQSSFKWNGSSPSNGIEKKKNGSERRRTDERDRE